MRVEFHVRAVVKIDYMFTLHESNINFRSRDDLNVLIMKKSWCHIFIEIINKSSRNSIFGVICG